MLKKLDNAKKKGKHPTLFFSPTCICLIKIQDTIQLAV